MITEKEAIDGLKELCKTVKKAKELDNMLDSNGRQIKYKRIEVLLAEEHYDIFEALYKLIKKRG